MGSGKACALYKGMANLDREVLTPDNLTPSAQNRSACSDTIYDILCIS